VFMTRGASVWIVGYSYRAWMPLLWKDGLSSHGRA